MSDVGVSEVSVSEVSVVGEVLIKVVLWWSVNSEECSGGKQV